jgi:hypothetical protein
MKPDLSVTRCTAFLLGLLGGCMGYAAAGIGGYFGQALMAWIGLIFLAGGVILVVYSFRGRRPDVLMLTYVSAWTGLLVVTAVGAWLWD